MSAEWDNGFCVRKPSWHKLENLLLEPPADRDEALSLGFPRRDGKPGHWEPIAMPVYAKTIGFDEVTGEPSEGYEEVEGFKLIQRDDDGTPLSVPKDSYEIIHNRDLYDIGMALAAADPKAHISSLFSVKGGAWAAMTIELDEPVAVAGDDTLSVPFLNVNTSHDGSTACRAGYGTIRQVCANTIMFTNMELDHGTMPSFTFRHTASVADRIEEAKLAISGARSQWAAFLELSDELAKLPCTDEALRNFIDMFVPMPEAVDLMTERQRENINRERISLHDLYTESATTEGHRGSALGLVDAGIEYLDHYRASRSTETLVRRTLVDSAPLKAKLIDLARTVCTAN